MLRAEIVLGVLDCPFCGCLRFLVRQKLVNGIKKTGSDAVTDIMFQTFPRGAFGSEDDVEDYVDDFKLQASNLIHSEKARDWLQTSLGDALTSACENN